MYAAAVLVVGSNVGGATVRHCLDPAERLRLCRSGVVRQIRSQDYGRVWTGLYRVSRHIWKYVWGCHFFRKI